MTKLNMKPYIKRGGFFFFLSPPILPFSSGAALSDISTGLWDSLLPFPLDALRLAIHCGSATLTLDFQVRFLGNWNFSLSSLPFLPLGRGTPALAGSPTASPAGVWAASGPAGLLHGADQL